MEKSKKVAIVTGSYRGIGLEIVKSLCQKFDGDVYITARSVDKCLSAVEKLEKLGLKPCYHELDVESADSVNSFAKFIGEKYGGVDILVNNAAILLKESKDVSIVKAATDTVRVNFEGVVLVWDAFFPLLKQNARVVHVSSRMGLARFITNAEIRNKFLADDLTVEAIRGLLNDYIEACKSGTHKQKGYSSPYSVTKVALNALTKVQQRMIDEAKPGANIVVSAMCPGYCKTDMTGNWGVLSAEQGAETAVYLALLPPDFMGARGGFWAEDQVIRFDGYMVVQGLPMVKKALFSLFR